MPFHSRSTIFLFASVLTASACVAPPIGQCSDVLADLDSRNAGVEARQNAVRGEHYFLAVDGYARSFPGLPDGEAFRRRLDYRVLPETSDVLLDESCEVYQQKAWTFAETYNQEMVKLVRRPSGPRVAD